MTKDANEQIAVGKIVGLHGLKGDVKICPFCDDINEIIGAKELYIGDVTQVFFDRRGYKKVILAKIKGAETIEQARGYIGCVLHMKRSAINLKDGEYLIQDLIGLQVVDADDGTVYGKLVDVIKTGANDVYAVKNEDDKETLIPAIKSVIKMVDLEREMMQITPIEGLFD
ncbi:MAG: ribosome maturation factor RimM [Oscillospiraceae bacterium]|nr:ribosome maturation factor RimM [Oscillospiraceae bacterium]